MPDDVAAGGAVPPGALCSTIGSACLQLASMRSCGTLSGAEAAAHDAAGAGGAAGASAGVAGGAGGVQTRVLGSFHWPE